jgi:sugar lactone lactonase YvrE
MMNRSWQQNLLWVIKIICPLVLTTSCGGDEDSPVDIPPPLIQNISPTSGSKSSVIVISGENFGTNAGNVKVIFNDKEAKVTSLTNTSITTEVPAKSGTGLIKVSVSGVVAEGPVFTYIPTITVSTLAGDGTFGFVNGIGTAATFQSPFHLCTDSKRNIFVADNNNHVIRKITPEGIVTTFAGNGTVAGDIFEPNGISADDADNLYVSDGCKIKKITPTGEVTILSGTQTLSCGYANGSAFESMFSYPYGIIADKSGNVYVAERDAHSVRKITSNGTSSTLAGGSYGDDEGLGAAAKFRYPHDVDVDQAGNIYVLDQSNFKIKKITPQGNVTTFIGSTQGHKNAKGTEAKIDVVDAFCVEQSTGIFYFIERTQDGDSVYVRTITPNGNVGTLLGTLIGHADGTANVAKLNSPQGIAVDSQGTLYISENYPRIRKIVIE